jgi:hypothetical protein
MDDEAEEFWKSMTKRVETLINARMDTNNEQLITLVSHLNTVQLRLKEIEQAIIIHSGNSMHIARHLSLIIEELNSLELYVSRDNPKLHQTFLALQRQQQEDFLKGKNK